MPDASPTISDLNAAYYANSGYDLPGGGVAMAGAFIQACRNLQNAKLARVSHGGRAEEIEFDAAIYEKKISDAKNWLYSQNVRQNGQNIRVFRRGEPFVPTYPGPYYGN